VFTYSLADEFAQFYLFFSKKESLHEDAFTTFRSLLPLAKLWITANKGTVELFPFIEDLKKANVPSNNKIAIAFTGGKDSTAVAIKAKGLGYEPTLVYIKGINKPYPQERLHAEKIAQYLKLPFTELVFDMKLKCDYPDHPFKNQMIIMMLSDYCVQHGIGNIALGNKECDTIQNCNLLTSFTDSYELFQTIQNCIPVKLCTLLENEQDSFSWITDIFLWELIHSCVIPDFRRPMIRKANIKNFGSNVLLSNRCGTCWKCSLEYLVLSVKGMLPFNEAYAEKCYNNYVKEDANGIIEKVDTSYRIVSNV
jgi:hypothetical protein